MPIDNIHKSTSNVNKLSFVVDHLLRHENHTGQFVWKQGNFHNFIHDWSKFEGTVQNISQLPKIRFLPGLRNPCFLTAEERLLNSSKGTKRQILKHFE